MAMDDGVRIVVARKAIELASPVATRSLLRFAARLRGWARFAPLNFIACVRSHDRLESRARCCRRPWPTFGLVQGG
jgi:hypothetical protein